MQYHCPKCGNSEQFVQYQWQLRRCAVDNEGVSLSTEEVCDSDVVAAISCARCNTHVRDFGVDINIRFPYGTGPQGEKHA